MTDLSAHIKRMAPSATMAITQKARDLRTAGHDIIALSSGEPDFDTPDNVKRAAVMALAQGKTKYTAVDGIPELKTAICRKFARDNGLTYAPSQINVSPGGKPVIFNALAATLDPGDEVIIPAPCWVSYPDMVRLNGGTPVIVPCLSEDGFKLTPEKLSATITPRTKWLLLNSPSNPTGAAYTDAELKTLGDILLQHSHVMILSDDIYEHLLYEGTFATMAASVPKLYERTLTMNGMSKAWAMTGWRIGFAGGPEWLIKGMAKVMGQTTSNPTSVAQYASVAALTGPQDILTERRAVFRERRDAVVTALNAAPGLTCAVPHGAFYVFPDVRDLLGAVTPSGRTLKTDTDIAQAILSEANVATVPGTAFHAPGHIRLSYATDMNTLMTACARVKTFCESLKPDA